MHLEIQMHRTQIPKALKIPMSDGQTVSTVTWSERKPIITFELLCIALEKPRIKISTN